MSNKKLIEKVKRICQQCGGSFEVYPSTIKHKGAKFCSLSCAGRKRTLRKMPSRLVDNVTEFLTEGEE